MSLKRKVNISCCIKELMVDIWGTILQRNQRSLQEKDENEQVSELVAW